MKHFYLLVILFVCISGTEAWACSCVAPSTPEKAFEMAKAVFTTHAPELIKNKHGYIEKVILHPDKFWKGNTNLKSIVVNPRTMCNYANFVENKKYLIYAHSHWDKSKLDDYSVSMCSRTKPLDEAEIEVRYLDALVANQSTQVIDQSLPDILANDKEKNNVRVEAARLLGWMIRRNSEDPPEKTVAAFIKASQSNNTKLKLTLAGELSNPKLRGRSNVKEALLRLLHDEDPTIRNISAGGLANVAKRNSPDVFNALHQEFNKANSKPWQDKKLRESTLAVLGVSISKVATTAKEKTEAVKILHHLIDEMNNPHNKVTVIQHLGFQRKFAKRSGPKLLAVLKTADSPYVQQYTLSALGDIKATEALDDIKPYVKDEKCYVVKHTVEAVHKIDPENFPEFFKTQAMPEMKKRFERCRHEFTWALQSIGPAAKEMKPFLVKQYQTIEDGHWLKGQLKNVIDALQ